MAKTKVSKNDTLAILKKVAGAADKHRPALRCFSRQQLGKDWYMCATDTHRLAMIKLPPGEYREEVIGECGMLFDTPSQYPRVGRVVPKEIAFKVAMPAIQFSQLVKSLRMTPMAKRSAMRLHMEFSKSTCALKLKSDGVELMATLQTERPVKESFKVAFNVGYLADMAPADGEGNIVFEFTSSPSTCPCVITCEDVPHYEFFQYVLMPMSLGE